MTTFTLRTYKPDVEDSAPIFFIVVSKKRTIEYFRATRLDEIVQLLPMFDYFYNARGHLMTPAPRSYYPELEKAVELACIYPSSIKIVKTVEDGGDVEYCQLKNVDYYDISHILNAESRDGINNTRVYLRFDSNACYDSMISAFKI